MAELHVVKKKRSLLLWVLLLLFVLGLIAYLLLGNRAAAPGSSPVQQDSMLRYDSSRQP